MAMMQVQSEVIDRSATYIDTMRTTIRTDADPQFHDLSDILVDFVTASGVVHGVVVAFCPHTSCGLLINENEQGLHEDLGGLLEDLAPRGRYWAHDDMTRRWQNIAEDEPANGHSHVRACVVTHPSITVPVCECAPVLGRWQRLFLVELDANRERTVVFQISGSRGAPASGAP